MGTWRDSERRREYYREYQKTPKYRARRGEYDRRYREKNREKIREQNRQYRDRNWDKPEWRAEHAAKQRRYQERKRQKIATIKKRKLARIKAVAERHRADEFESAKSDHEGRALAPSSGLGRAALVFDDNDVVDLLRIAVEREGGQGAFARHHGINRSQLNTILTGRRAVGAAIAELVGLRKAYIVNDKRRALALSSGPGRKALVFDDNDVVDLLRIAVEREGGQGAFSRHSGVDRAYLSRVLNSKEPPGRSIAKSLRLRKVYIVK